MIILTPSVVLVAVGAVGFATETAVLLSGARETANASLLRIIGSLLLVVFGVWL